MNSTEYLAKMIAELQIMEQLMESGIPRGVVVYLSVPQRDVVVEALKRVAQGAPERKALVSLLTIIDDLDQYQKRPERGDYGVECACCMGELFDAEERVKIEAARALTAVTSTDGGGK